ncbi:MAG: glutathione binding-like protein, partial [Gammaproteobacteria bacterium]
GRAQVGVELLHARESVGVHRDELRAGMRLRDVGQNGGGLVTDQGIITETPAILTYIAQSHPGAKLIPMDAYGFARVQEFNAYLCSTVHPAHAHRVRGYRWADDEAAIAEMARKAPSVLGDCFELIEREMLAGPWVMGDSFTISDPYLFTISGWLEADGVDIERYPKVRAHRERMADRESVRRALEREPRTRYA